MSMPDDKCAGMRRLLFVNESKELSKFISIDYSTLFEFH